MKLSNNSSVNMAAFMRGAEYATHGWHRNLNKGDEAFIIALREKYFPFPNHADYMQISLKFEKGKASRNQEVGKIYLRDLEFPADLGFTPVGEDEPVSVIDYLSNSIEALGLGLVLADIPEAEGRLNKAKIVVEKSGDKLIIANGELAKITNKVLAAHIDYMAKGISEERNRDIKKNKNARYMKPRDFYQNYLGKMLEGVGIENSIEVSIAAVKECGRDCGDWQKALTRAVEHAKEIIPQTKMYKTSSFKLDGKVIDVPQPPEKAEGNKWEDLALRKRLTLRGDSQRG